MELPRRDLLSQVCEPNIGDVLDTRAPRHGQPHLTPTAPSAATLVISPRGVTGRSATLSQRNTSDGCRPRRSTGSSTTSTA